VRVLVTGGAGFIGSTLVDRLLAEGHTVDVVDDLSTGSLANLAQARAEPRHKFSFQRIDVRAPAVVELIKRRRPEVIFHLAAQADVRVSVERPGFDAEVNVIGTINVLEGARAAGSRKVVFAGSGGTLYGEPGELPVRESHPQHPLSPYGVSKKAAGDYLAAYRELHGVEFTILALANVYGPRQDPHGEAGVIAIFCERLRAGARPVVFGDGRQTRDYVYVGDVAEATLAALQSPVTGPVNVGAGAETSVLDLVDALRALAGDAAFQPEHAPPRPGEARRSCLDSSRAAAELGWHARTPLPDGLRATLESLGTAG
jgi:UDP-glucose 4-epimerase